VADLTDDEISAMWDYLRTVPPIVNAVPSPFPEAVDSSDAGRAAFHKYGCNSCHGNDGGGTQELAPAAADYPTDDALIAYIKHPEIAKPGVAMPTWEGTILEAEYAPLARYVRSLSEARQRSLAGAVSGPPGTATRD